MIPSAVAAAAFAAVIVTLIGYLFAARQGAKRKITHPDDYFLARNRLTPNDFGDTQIAYALQMSTVYPFFILAAAGAWLVPVLNSLFWFIGILFFMGLVGRFKPFLGQSRTIHALIAEANGSQRLRPLASSMTIIAFAGVVVFEIVYGASVFRVLFGDNNIVYYVIICSLTAYLVTYIWYGGETATLRTEQLQLLVAYLGLHFALAHMFATSEVNMSGITPSIVPWLVFAACVAMLWSRGRALAAAIRAKRVIIGVGYSLMLVSLITLMVALGAALPRLNYGNFLAVDSTVGSLHSVDFWFMLGTAALLPVFWQFVDLTNWQRICALAASNAEQYATSTRRGFIDYLIESPLSWLLAVLLGLTAPQVMTLTGAGADPFEMFIRHFLLEPGLPQIVGVFLVAGIVGVFMSTADAAITAMGYAYAYDLSREGRTLVDQENLTEEQVLRVVRSGRRFMAVSTGAVVVLFIALDWVFTAGQTFVGLLFAFYTPVVSLAPAVLCPLILRRRPPAVFAFLSILIGAGVGLGIGIYSAVGHPEVQWYPAPLSVIVSWSLYTLGLPFGQRIPQGLTVTMKRQV